MLMAFAIKFAFKVLPKSHPYCCVLCSQVPCQASRFPRACVFQLLHCEKQEACGLCDGALHIKT